MQDGRRQGLVRDAFFYGFGLQLIQIPLGKPNLNASHLERVSGYLLEPLHFRSHIGHALQSTIFDSLFDCFDFLPFFFGESEILHTSNV